jgi:two-component system sensor histidine kinase YesM
VNLHTSIKRKFNDLKLRNKLIISFIAVVFIPVTFVGLFLTNQLRQIALNDALEQTEMTMDRMRQQTIRLLKVPIDISRNLLIDDRLKTILSTDYKSRYQLVVAYQNYPDIERYVSFTNEIDNIRLYTENETMISNWEFFPADETTTSQEWYQEAIQYRGIINWRYLPDETKRNEPYLSLVRMIEFDNFKYTNVLVITVSKVQLQAVVDSESIKSLIVDDHNNVITTNFAEWRGKTLDEIFPDLDLTGTGKQETKLNGELVNILVDYVRPEASSSGLRIISVYSVEDIVAESNRFSRLGLMVILASVIVSFILIYWVSSLLTRRLLKFSQQIGRAAIGDFETTLPIDGNDEIGQLSRQYNFMIRSIKELIEEVRKTHWQKEQLELKQQEIKLKMLASQINPHFLFNALESIRMQAHIKGEKEIAGVVKMLGRLMRKSLETQGHHIALKDEIDIVHSYLEIQMFRHRDRLTYELKIDEEAGKQMIPPLIIQPLVENAVVHGIERKESEAEPLKVTVKAEIKGDRLVVEVEDNGVGISEERLQEIIRMLDEQDEGNRIGLSNVHHRLQMVYGESSGLVIESEERVGTTVRFSIPAD